MSPCARSKYGNEADDAFTPPGFFGPAGPQRLTLLDQYAPGLFRSCHRFPNMDGQITPSVAITEPLPETRDSV